MPAPPLSLRGVHDSLRVPTLRDWVFSAKAFLATAIALVVGFSQNLENPYWAVMTIYVILNPPETGAIRSKALFRFLGTVIGGVVMMALTGIFGDQLGILVTVTIAVIAIATFLRQIDRTPLNYLWFSGGITAGVVALVNLMQPLNVFDYATARMGEILLGILAVTLVDSLIWPRPMTPDFLATLASWRGHARAWAVDALGDTARPSIDETRQRALRHGLHELTKAVGVIDAKAMQLPFDVVTAAPRGRHLDLVRRQVVEIIADLAAIELWSRALGRSGIDHPALTAPISSVTAWLQGGSDMPGAMVEAHCVQGAYLAAELEAERAARDPLADQAALMERGLLTRLATLVRNWSALSIALRAIETGGTLPGNLNRLAHRAKPVRSVDYLGALFDVAPLVLSMTAATMLWYVTAWGSGGGALLFSFIGCIFLIGQGHILRSSTGLLLWVLAAFSFVFLYQFAVLPRVTDFPVLIAALGCALIPLGLMMAMSMAGMLICVFTFSFLGLQNAYAADFSTSLQTLSASLVGLLIAITSLYLCSYDRARFAARRLIEAVRQDIVDLACQARVPEHQRFLFLAIDRLSLYFPAAELAAASGPLARVRMLDDFAVGVHLLTLRRLEPDVSFGTAKIIKSLRTATANAYQPGGDDSRLLVLIESALVRPEVRSEPANDQLLEALSGLHVALTDARHPAVAGEALP